MSKYIQTSASGLAVAGLLLAAGSAQAENVVTVNVVQIFGTIDPARMASALEQTALTYEFATAPDAALYFTDAYLPEGGFALK